MLGGPNHSIPGRRAPSRLGHYRRNDNNLRRTRRMHRMPVLFPARFPAVFSRRSASTQNQLPSQLDLVLPRAALHR